MRFEANAPIYTAFALISIESVWPNPEGGELTADSYDMELLGLEATAQPAGLTSSKRVDFSSGKPNMEEYSRTQGYYKILPLNVVAVSAQTSAIGGGSSFEVKFTLDDLLLITDENNKEVMSNATGLPISRVDDIMEGIEGFPSMFMGADDSVTLPEDSLQRVSDKELGLARYRISGPKSGFNIEDLVTPNDTVTIWLYHDPQEFYYKDAEIIDTHTLTVQKGMAWVIGSGDRRGQHTTDSPTFSEYILGATGMISEYMETTMTAAALGEADVNLRGADKDNISSIIQAYLQEATAGAEPTSWFSERDGPTGRLEQHAMAAFGPDIGHRVYQWLLVPMNTPEGIKKIGDSENRETVMRQRRNILTRMIEEMDEGNDGFLLTGDVTELSVYDDLVKYFDDPESLVHGVNIFASAINELYSEFVKTGPRTVVTRTRQNFSNGRTIITSGSDKPTHGNTPYLALKGQIGSIKTNVGTSQGTFTVSISGRGMEKVISEHEVYYEDIYGIDYTTKLSVDYTTFFVFMSPPRALMAIVNRWSPKKIIFGPPSAFFAESFNSLWTMRVKADKDEVPEDEEHELEDENFTIEENVPLRGNLVMTEAVMRTGETPKDKMRIFAPVNFVDTSRIREMSLVLDESYTVPEAQAVINTSKTLQQRVSVYENVRQVVGVGRFYEVFVDETGKIRYRLTFEAMERTPEPLYIPTIQDVDLLGDGAAFEQTDSELLTMVDVTPLRKTGAQAMLGLAFMGRSLPDTSPVPIHELPEEAEPITVSSELFRYGLRTADLEDIYTSQTYEAKRKAEVLRGFYGKPLKKASLKVRGNTSYRAGETVLVSLQNNKHRSRTPIDIPKLIEWLEWMGEDDRRDVMEMYIGVDERLSHPEYYEKTVGYVPLGEGVFYGAVDTDGTRDEKNSFSSDPKEYVRQGFLRTLRFIQDTLPGTDVITPDYFPTTYWALAHHGNIFKGWDENTVLQDDIVELYASLLKSAVGGQSKAAEDVQRLYLNNPGIMNAIRFQNFRAASYYIEAVSHNFNQDTDMSTSLSLNYGQDTLVLLDPVNFLPAGFLSLEKNMRIGWNSKLQRDVMFDDYTEGNISYSPLQLMFLNQYKKDRQFKRGDFLYTAQGFRNISNYMHEISLMEGLESSSVSETVDSEVFNEAVVAPEVDMARVREVTEAYGEEYDRAQEERRLRLERARDEGITE